MLALKVASPNIGTEAGARRPTRHEVAGKGIPRAKPGLRAQSAGVGSLGFICSLPRRRQRFRSLHLVFRLVLCFFEAGCPYVVLAGFKLVATLPPSPPYCPQ